MDDVSARIQKRYAALITERGRLRARLESVDAKIETLQEFVQNSHDAKPLKTSPLFPEFVKPIARKPRSKPGGLSMVAAAELVLKEMGKPMHVRDIWTIIADRKLAESHGKRPHVNLNSAMNRLANRGEKFAKEMKGSSVYKLLT